MQILAIADKVEQRFYRDGGGDKFPKVDLILACGDLPPEYLTHLAASFKVPLAYVRGNHDIRYEWSPPQGCIDLHGRILTLEGIRLLGLEGSRWYNGGPVQYTEREMGRQVARLRWSLWRSKGVDLVITHAPPRHIHDEEDPCHRGFRCFNTLIQRYRPRFFIHGHIHTHFHRPEERITRVGETQVINAYGYYLFPPTAF